MEPKLAVTTISKLFHIICMQFGFWRNLAKWSVSLSPHPLPPSQLIAQINTVVLLSLLNYIFCWFVVCFFVFWVTLKAVKRNEMELFPLFFFFLSNVFPFAASLCWHGKCFALLTDKSPKCLNQRLIVDFVERLGKK